MGILPETTLEHLDICPEKIDERTSSSGPNTESRDTNPTHQLSANDPKVSVLGFGAMGESHISVQNQDTQWQSQTSRRGTVRQIRKRACASLRTSPTAASPSVRRIRGQCVSPSPSSRFTVWLAVGYIGKATISKWFAKTGGRKEMKVGACNLRPEVSLPWAPNSKPPWRRKPTTSGCATSTVSTANMREFVHNHDEDLPVDRLVHCNPSMFVFGRRQIYMAGMHCTLQRNGLNGRAEVNTGPMLSQTATSQRDESGLSNRAGPPCTLR